MSWQQSSSKERSIRGKLFWPSPLGLGIECDSKQRLKPYLYGSATPALGLWLLADVWVECGRSPRWTWRKGSGVPEASTLWLQELVGGYDAKI
ncbi:MAG: hypothetical protein QF595_00690 [Dehalococcoidia bacterium]|nr:hypothetical protein [Dehalococcoidia bacterium]